MAGTAERTPGCGSGELSLSPHVTSGQPASPLQAIVSPVKCKSKTDARPVGRLTCLRLLSSWLPQFSRGCTWPMTMILSIGQLLCQVPCSRLLPTGLLGSGYSSHPRVRTGGQRWPAVVLTGPGATANGPSGRLPSRICAASQRRSFPRLRMAHQPRV